MRQHITHAAFVASSGQAGRCHVQHVRRRRFLRGLREARLPAGSLPRIEKSTLSKTSPLTSRREGRIPP